MEWALCETLLNYSESLVKVIIKMYTRRCECSVALAARGVGYWEKEMRGCLNVGSYLEFKRFPHAGDAAAA